MLKDVYNNVSLMMKEENGIYKINIIENNNSYLVGIDYKDYEYFNDITVYIKHNFLTFSYIENKQKYLSFKGKVEDVPKILKNSLAIRKYIPIKLNDISLEGVLTQNSNITINIPLNIAIVKVINIINENFKKN